MREIKFRGKIIDNGEWVYGYLYEDIKPNRHLSYILELEFIPASTIPSNKFIEVDQKTVGQFTGLLDKNGVEIYEGDVVEWKHSEQGKEDEFYTEKQRVNFHNGSFGFENWYTDSNGNLKNRMIHHASHHTTPDLYYVEFDIEVIGNIHEHEHLLLSK